MRNRKKAFVALAVGSMLVGTTGTTFALWHLDAPVTGQQTTTGDLSVNFTAESVEWVGSGTLAAGASRTGTATLNTDLDGTNLVGTLKLTHAYPENVTSFGVLEVSAEYFLDGAYHPWTGFPVAKTIVESGKPIPATIPLRFTVKNGATEQSVGSTQLQNLGTVTAILEQTRGVN